MKRSMLDRRQFIKLASLLPATRFFASPTRSLQIPGANNILIILFDALSARNVSLYGYPRETMPNLARFAEQATVYHNHIAGGNFTSPGTASLLTGTYSFTHKAFHNYSEVKPEFVQKNIFGLFDQYYRLVYSQNPLVEVLFNQFQDNFELYKLSHELFISSSFITHLFPGDEDISTLSWYQWNSKEANPVTGSLFMPDLEYYLRKSITESYADQFPRGLPEVRGVGYYLIELTLDWVMRSLLEVPKPHLFYIHLLPPHSPYRARSEFVDTLDDGWMPPQKPNHLFSMGIDPENMYENRRFYDEYIQYVDAEFGRLNNWMEDNGIFEDTWVVFTSDHGEIFERAMVRHAKPTFLHPLVHIPLLIRSPGQTQRLDIHQPTNAVDVLPTLLQANKQPLPNWLEGEVLPPYGSQNPSLDRAFLAFDGREFYSGEKVTKGTAMILRWPYKLTYYWRHQVMKGNPEYIELFDIHTDPEELCNLSTERRQLSLELLAELKEHIKKSGQITFPK